MYVIVAVLVTAGLGAALFVIFAGPPGGAPAPSLDRVEVTAQRTTVDQLETVAVFAKAIDTEGLDQTRNASFAWSANPATAVNFLSPITQSTINVRAILGGTATLTVNATWSSSTKQNSQDITIRSLRLEISPSKTLLLVTEEAVTLAVRAVRPDGTTATNYISTLIFSSTDPGAGLPSPPAGISFGEALFTGVTISQPGPVEISARDATVPSITGTATLTGNRRPTPDIRITPDPSDDRKITANGTASSDPDGDSIVTYAWDFGDDGTASTSVANHVYATHGTYTIRLAVVDARGGPNTAEQAYLVRAPPAPSFGVKPRAVGADILVTADASASFDPDGSIVNYNWTWGDASYNDTNLPVIDHLYNSSLVGQKVTIVLVVTDNDGLKGNVNKPITVIEPIRPVAVFGWTTDQLNRTVRADAGASSDGNGDIVYYNWSWGDGTWTNGTAAVVFHPYEFDGLYLINLTVEDATNLANWTEQSVGIAQPQLPPDALFSVRRTQFQVDLDASASFDWNKDIVSYEWSFGDGMTGTGVLISYEYTSPGTYTIRLDVTDSRGNQDNATTKVSVGPTTLDVEIYDLFNVPYRGWWDFRAVYGDFPLTADCFSFENIPGGAGSPNPSGTGACDIPPSGYSGETWAEYPYVNPIAWVGDRKNIQIYAPYRMRMAGVNQPGANLSQPIYLPVFNSAEPAGSTLNLVWEFNYLTKPETEALDAECGSSAAFGYDGFVSRNFFTVTMDLQESKRIFGVVATTPAEAADWWAANSDSDCSIKIGIESKWERFMVDLGGTSLVMGPYDIFSSYEWFYQPFMTNFVASVDPSTGETIVVIDHLVWGAEVVFPRWFYWGPTLYLDPGPDGKSDTPDDILNAEIYPHNARGWWKWELAWVEDLLFDTTIGATSQSFTLQTVMQYHFAADANPGPDGVFHSNGPDLTPGNADDVVSTDDIAEWLWMPVLTDYAYGGTVSPKHTVSELDPYLGKTYLYARPGQIYFGTQYKYDLVPAEWDLAAGDTIVVRVPTTDVLCVDPYSPLTSASDGSNLILVSCRLHFTKSTPSPPPSSEMSDSNGDGLVDTVRLFGPIDWGAPGQPLWGFPALEFAAASSGSLAGAALVRGALASSGTPPALAATMGAIPSPIFQTWALALLAGAAPRIRRRLSFRASTRGVLRRKVTSRGSARHRTVVSSARPLDSSKLSHSPRKRVATVAVCRIVD